LEAQLFKTYFDQYFDTIRNYLYYKCGDIELATDLTQDVFLRIWHKKLPLKEPHVKPLLYKIAKDTWVSHIRKITTEQKYLEQLPLLYTIENSSEQNDVLKQAYEKGLAQMPEKQRTAFLMNRLEGLTYKEISIRLEISSKAVEKRIHKALKTFRQVLGIISK
jgi:RNA polymerase sigma-70 factor (ECF subfamily)